MTFRRLAPALLALALLACGGEASSDRGRVLILGLDGLDPETVDLLMAEGRLPSFAQLRQEGAYGLLRSQEPLLSPIIWTTIATGKGPEAHGIGHFVATARTGEQIPASSDLRQVKAIWNIASEAGKTVASVGWWATWPPEQLDGWIVSDHAAYHFLFEDGFGESAGAEASRGNETWPPELGRRIAPLLRRPGELTAEELAPFVDVPPEELERPFDFQDELAHFRWALATAKSYRDVGLTLWREERPDLELIYIEGTDSTSHLFGHLFRAEGLAGELAEQQRRYGRTVEAMYLFADRLLGEVMAALDATTTLMVLSDHGFELGQLHDDPSRTRDLRRVSERFHKLDGILYLYGHRVKPYSRIDLAGVLDVAPTVLALLGLPPAHDMPGRVLSEAFTTELGGERIASYEEGAGATTTAVAMDSATTVNAPGDAVRQAQLQHLESLGYLGGTAQESPSGATASPSPTAERNLAAIHFQAGRYREAAEIYRRLIQAEPESSALRASLAGALGALGRYDQAFTELDRAIELDPLNVEALHNRAVIFERRGQRASAIADYRTAVRYRPRYEPSRQALQRLTGSADPRDAPASDAERRASRLVEQASQAARRTDYPEAMRLLDEAERAAPGYVVVYQYRSNVAYLMGDVEAARTALEKAIELEPDNALFRANLERLQGPGG